MATRRYMADAESADFEVTEAVGASTASKNIELTVDWDQLASDGLDPNQARLLVLNQLQHIASYIEQTGKNNVVA